MSMELSALAHPSHGRILDIIRAAGSISRVEIARESGMTAASVTNIVRLLLDIGLVKEIGHAESTGGKRRTLLSIAPESRYAVGVHMQRENITYTVSDLAGRLVGRRLSSTPVPTDSESLVGQLATDIDAVLEDLGIRKASVYGVGVAASRTLETAIRARTEIVPALSRALSLPVIDDREAVAAAIGEFWQGTASQPSSFASFYMGEEFGAGFVNSGAVWRGASGNAGNIGHISLDAEGPLCACGRRGCLQVLASPSAVVVEATRRGMLDDSLSYSVADRFDALARRAVRGEQQPLEVIAGSASKVAAVATIVANVLDIEMYVLSGSGFAIAGSIYADHMRKALDHHASALSLPQITVELAHNPRDAAAVGASALILQGALAPR